MALPLPNEVQKLWDIWDLRVLIMISLFLQAILVLVASSRKRTGSKPVIVVIWAAYLLADWVAAVAVGQASGSQLLSLHGRGGSTTDSDSGGDLVAFWAPFLLLHLGGPDSITSFSLEDNELWLRHLLGLVLQVLAVIYVFLQTLPNNSLWVPTTLILIAGFIKYAERTKALYNASLDRLGASVLPRADPGSEYEKISRRLNSLKKSNLPTRWVIVHNPERMFWDSIGKSEDLDDKSLMEAGYEIFKIFKGLIVGQVFSSKERETSRSFFLKRNALEAFRLVEFELSFMYEILHTKLAAARSNSWYVFRFFCLSAEIASFFNFLLIDKRRYYKLDRALTYMLLGGAMVLETISLVMLLFSDWTAISAKNTKVGRYIMGYVLNKQRWSESVSQCNFINYCLARRRRWFDTPAEFLGFDELFKVVVLRRISASQPVSKNHLKEFIFDELKAKSLKATSVEIAEGLCSQGRAADLLKDSHSKLVWSIGEFQFAESVLLWHIATDLCFFKDGSYSSDKEIVQDRNVCQILSNYMLYLLELKPEMMGPVAGNWKLVFQDTCAEAQRFFRKFSKPSDACRQLLSVETMYRSAIVKGGRSKSVLFDACMLANQLLDLGNQEERWKTMNRVWVEFMSYAANNCRPTVHAQQPSTGGELLTFVWLLNTHLGLGKQFYHQVSVGKVRILQRK